MDNHTIDVIVAVCMMLMAVALLLFVSTLMSVLYKSIDTLGAIQRLCNTIDQEIGPTAVQLREVMNGINQLRGATTQKITAVGHKVEEVSDSFGSAVNNVQKQTSVLGTGILAGFRAYLHGKPEEGSDKRITMDKGAHHNE